MTARVLLILGLWFVTACRTASYVPDDLTDGQAPRKGVLHTVERGQTLWRIARAYGVSVQDLAEVNDLTDPTQIKAGAALWIPGAERALHVEPAPSLVGKPPEPAPTRPGTKRPADDDDDDDAPSRKVQVSHTRFIWPVKGILFSRYGVRDGTQHEGIDISAPKGTTVMAADDGEVLYAGVQRGYGNIVLVKHADGLITIYAHNDENGVAAGQRVRRGQQIARVGETGRATGPHVHFEVRKDRVPRNPLFFLPPSP